MKGRKFSNTGLNASELGLIYALKKIFNNKNLINNLITEV
jgi:hypothetical protein